MISIVQSPCPLRASRNLPPAQPPSAKMWRNHGNRWRMAWSSTGAPSRSCTSAAVALAAVDLFPGVVARKTSAFGRLHALAVDVARCGTGLAAFQVTRAHNQQLVEGHP